VDAGQQALEPGGDDKLGRVALNRGADVGGDVHGVHLKLVIRFNDGVRKLLVAARQVPLQNRIDDGGPGMRGAVAPG
jgi:hypothetical protein